MLRLGKFARRSGGYLAVVRKLVRACGVALAANLVAVAVTPIYGASFDRNALPKPVLEVLAKHKIPETGLSVFVQDVSQDEPLLSVAAHVPRNPASAIKLLTTLAALETLSPAFTWRTTAAVTGDLKDGILHGDLYIRGRGDPFLVTERFWKFLFELRQTGLRHIAGNVIVDDNYFGVPPGDPGLFDGRPYRPYNVLPTATLLNFGATRFWLVPNVDSGRLDIVTDPPSADMTIDNDVELTSAKCTAAAKNLRFRVVSRTNGGHVKFSGSYSSRCGRYALIRSVADAHSHVLGSFSSIWESLGGSVSGHRQRGSTPANARVVHSYDSPPLAEIIRTINKFSNNVMTRQLLLTLGAEKFGPPATLAKGREAIKRWLSDAGLNFPELFVDNGAGLSRHTRISAGSLGALLVAAFKSPLMSEFVSSLPVSAVDGTLRKRFKNHPLSRRLHLKTGTIDDVRTMGGYLLTEDGRTLAVVSLHNYPKIQLRTGTEIQNALLEWLFTK